MKAVANVNDLIAPELIGFDIFEQNQIDQIMLEVLMEPKIKSKLGANAILGVSLAVAKAASHGIRSAPVQVHRKEVNANTLPVPMMNILNGGSHADNGIDFQEFMVMPAGASSFFQNPSEWEPRFSNELKAVAEEPRTFLPMWVTKGALLLTSKIMWKPLKWSCRP